MATFLAYRCGKGNQNFVLKTENYETVMEANLLKRKIFGASDFEFVDVKTNTKVGRMIRLFTADDVNHCSIYFDGDKSTLYAFRREYRHKIFSGRFGVETLQQMSRDANMYYEEVSVEITDNQYRRMMRLIDFFKYKNYKYNYVGLVAFKLRINTLLKWS